MGTNYYIETDKTEPIHIGKKSAGWTFYFHGPVLGEGQVRTAEQWRFLTMSPKVTIRDEYGSIIDLETFWLMVENSRGGWTQNSYEANNPSYSSADKFMRDRRRNKNWVDPNGWDFCPDEFF